MLKVFPIDFIRQALEQKLLEEHIKNPNFFGGINQVSILSFYEQLKSQDEVDRFVETYRDLTEQQNRTGLILNGVLVSPENPSITNLYSSLIIPMTFNCSFRCTLGNRDQAIETINNLIEKLKGRKADIAQLNCTDEKGKTYSVPFMVGTIGKNDGAPRVNSGDYLGEIVTINDIATLLQGLFNKGVFTVMANGSWLYVKKDNKLQVAYYDNYQWQIITDDGSYADIVFPPEHTSFEKYKVSFSFDAIRCDEPRNLNGDEYCELSFGGSATLVSDGVKLGNDLLKIKISKNSIKGTPNITFTDTGTYLEPLEMPSGSNANTQLNQLVSNNFKVGSHTDGLALTLQYTFICDMNIPLVKQWYKYARYGTQGLTVNDISPNMVYEIIEYSCSWGDFENDTVKAKINDSIDIENTESDAMTISIVMQIQGDTI